MKTHLIAIGAVFLAFSTTTAVLAAECQVASKAKPTMSFTTTSAAPRAWKAGKVPKTLTRALGRIGTGKGKDTSDTSHPLDGVEFICDDWIAICANDDCTHGVVECDGDCIDF